MKLKLRHFGGLPGLLVERGGSECCGLCGMEVLAVGVSDKTGCSCTKTGGMIADG